MVGSTISNNSNLQARVQVLPVPLPGNMSASKCFSHPAAFWFPVSLPPDNITFNPANKKTDQSPSDFQTDFSAAADATLDAEQISLHTRTILVDNIASLQDCDGQIIAVLEVHELQDFVTFGIIPHLNGLVIQLTVRVSI